MTRGIRKPVAKLSRADFAAHPVWEWALDEEGVTGQDETSVRPTEHQAVPAAAFAQFLVSASATLKDGGVVPACIEVTVAGKTKRFSPMFVFMLDRQLPFAGAETTRALSRYTKIAGNSPKSWELSVTLAGERRKRRGRAHSLAFGVVLNVLELVMAKRMQHGRGN